MSDPQYPAPPPPGGPPPGGPPPGGPPPGGGAGWPPPPSGPGGPAGPGGPGGPGGWSQQPGGPGGPGGWPQQPGGPSGGGGGRRTLLIVLGALAVLAVVGVGIAVLTGDDDGSSSGPPAGVAIADLEPALITQADVGDDYVVDVFDPDDEGENDLLAGDVDASEQCRSAIESFDEVTAPTGEIGASFANETDGFIEQTISIPSEGQPDLGAVRSAIEQCDEPIGITEDGATGEVLLGTTDVDGLGDAAVGITIEIELEAAAGITVSFDMYGVLWERDGIHATVAGFGGFDEATAQVVPTDTGRLEDLARTSDQRFADALAG